VGTTPPAPAPAAVAPAQADPPAPAEVKVTVVSSPPGARVVEVSSGRALGTTPLSASLTRSSSPSRLRLERAGRRPTEVEVVPDAEREVQVSVALPRMTRAPTAAAAAAKVARKQKHPDPFKLTARFRSSSAEEGAVGASPPRLDRRRFGCTRRPPRA